MSVERFAMWFSIVIGALFIITIFVQFKLEKVLKAIAGLFVIAFCAVGIGVLIRNWSTAPEPNRSNANHPTSPAGGPPVISQPPNLPTSPAVGPPVIPAANAEITVALGGGVKLKMVRVPQGKAWLGGGGNVGTKQEEVAEFYMGAYELSQSQWKAVMGADNNPSNFKGDDLPVEKVSWNHAKEFIAKLNIKMIGSGYFYRLPTEVEWEYACRGGPISEEESKFSFYFDKPTNDLSAGDANFDWDYPAGEGTKGKPRNQTVKVGTYKPNKLGLYDMHGNVSEWTDTLDGSGRVDRGGSWGYDGRRCTAAYRGKDAPGYSYVYLGFRLAASPSE